MERIKDTLPEAEVVLRNAIREMPFTRKWEQMRAIYRAARELHAARLRRQRPSASVEEIRDDWSITMLGKDMAKKIQEARRARADG